MDFGQSYLQSATNFIRLIKGRRREQSAAAFGALCFLVATFLKSKQWIPNWKGYDVASIALYAIGVVAFVYAFRRLWRATHATDLPPVKDRPSVIKGPSAFTPGDGELFRRLGRESELQELMGYVLDNQVRLVVLMGESGAGKTSLLRAGLPHILKDKGVRVHYWEAVPTDSAERLLRAIQEDWSANGSAKPATLDELINPAATLGAEQHVIVLDQFEQLRGRNAVLQFLRRVARESLPPHRLTWIVAFRREYRADWSDFVIPEHKRGFYPKEMSLRLFTAEAARDVISQLIQEAGLQVEQPVVNNLIEAAANADNQVSPVDIGIGLLVLSELHDRQAGRTLTVKDYQFAGGAEGLLMQYINRCLERFAETEREPLLKALLALRNPETNQRLAEGLALDQLATEAATDPRRRQPQLDRLAQRDIRLLETVTKDSVTHYRLPHERLIPALHRLTGKLLGEIEQARLRFENAFLAWQKNDKRGHYLLKGKDLKLIERNASQMPWGSAEQEKQNYLWQSLRRRSLIRVGAMATILALIGLGYAGSLQYQRLEARRYLSESGYPPQLYDWQHQLKKLELAESLDLERFTWLSSKSVEELEIHARSSTNSLTGLSSLARCSSLKKLTLNLTYSQVSNLEPLAKLDGLTQLTLTLSGSQVSSLEPLTKLGKLTRLALDLSHSTSGSQVNSLEPLTRLRGLTQFTLDISHNQVVDLEPLTKLNGRTQLTLNLYNNKVNNLELLAKLTGLTQLTLSLDNQVSNLELLTKLRGLTQLSLDLKYSQVSDLKPISKLKRLTQLTLNLNDKVRSLEPLANLSGLKQLTLKPYSSRNPLELLGGLTNLGGVIQFPPDPYIQMNDLEPLAKLNGLTQFTLDLDHTYLRSLEPLAKLSGLTELTLDEGLSMVSDWDPLTRLSKLARLMLNLRFSSMRSLDPLVKLNGLTQLTLNLSYSQISDLEPLAKMNGLTQLELNFSETKVSNLEPLAKLNRLTHLTLHFDKSQVNNLEPLIKLSGLTQLTLFLNNQVSNLEPLTKLTRLQTLSIPYATKVQRMSLLKLPASVVELRF
jgi:Leucine-rich repeat (LRR) protein